LGIDFKVKDEVEGSYSNRNVLRVTSISSARSSDVVSKPIFELDNRIGWWHAGSMRTFTISIQQPLHDFEPNQNLICSRQAQKRGWYAPSEGTSWTHPEATHLKRNPETVKIRRTEFWYVMTSFIFNFISSFSCIHLL
jgi:hypothetical protein